LRIDRQAIRITLQATQAFDQAAIHPGHGARVEQLARAPGRARVLVVRAAVVVGDEYGQLAALQVVGQVGTGNHLAQRVEGAVGFTDRVQAEDVEHRSVVVDRAVLGRAGMLLRDAADVFAHGAVGRGEHLHAVGRLQLGVDLGQHLRALCIVGGAGQERPALRVQVDAAFGIGRHAKLDVVIGDAACEPAAIPQVRVGRGVHGCRAIAVACLHRPIIARGADVGPQVQRVRSRYGQPARNAAALVADHVHRIAPVALFDVGEAPRIAPQQEPVHRQADALERRFDVAAVRADRHVEDRAVTRFIEIGLQTHGQPDAVVGVRDLVDVFEFGAFEQQNPIRHGAVGFLLAQCMQEGGAGSGRLDEHHAHIVLQVVAGLRVGAEAIDVAVVIDLARQPRVDEVVQLGVGRGDLQHAVTLGDVGGVVARGNGKAFFAQVALA
jgi:hypothetical protein